MLCFQWNEFCSGISEEQTKQESTMDFSGFFHLYNRKPSMCEKFFSWWKIPSECRIYLSNKFNIENLCYDALKLIWMCPFFPFSIPIWIEMRNIIRFCRRGNTKINMHFSASTYIRIFIISKKIHIRVSTVEDIFYSVRLTRE